MREEAGTWRYRRYLQQLDKEMYLKVLKRQVFDTIVGSTTEEDRLANQSKRATPLTARDQHSMANRPCASARTLLSFA